MSVENNDNENIEKNVVLNPNLRTGFQLLKNIFFLIIYIFIYLLEIIKVNLEFFRTNSYKQQKYLTTLLDLWLDEYNQPEKETNYNDYTVSEEISKLPLNKSFHKQDYKSIAEYFFTNKMFHLAGIFYNKYYSNIFSSEYYYYKAICIMEKIKNDFFYISSKDYILKIYIKILRIITFIYLKVSLLFCNDNIIEFDIYKNLGIILNSLNLDERAEYYFNKASNIKPKDSLILNNLALFYTKNKKLGCKNIKENMFCAIKYIHNSLRYSTENNREKIFFNLLRIQRHYKKNINIRHYKNILYKIDFNNCICCSYIAKNYEDVSENETIYCIKKLSELITKNLYKQVLDYKYLKNLNLQKKYLEEYKYYMIFNTYFIFYHLKNLDLLKYFLLEDIKLPQNLKKSFYNLTEREIK
jgi:hypothetical protein